MSRIGVYPGTFDPPTLGHFDIIRRGAKLVDRLVLGIGVNSSKAPLFDFEERLEMMRELVAGLADEPGVGEIAVVPFKGLVVHFAREHRATVLLRGLRSGTDFDYEFQMTGMNATMAPEVETVFLMADLAHQAIASSLVKDVAKLGGPYAAFVPPVVAERLRLKLEKLKSA
ncbi:pantetheine-phosphate adenylyltransferase [Zavarzinia compransoris]|uniref:Phosphopantetheine adenylyltransferase n=1 Tax=Zavarzinia compransoris TaxID=1264899 RepID=A0A317E1T3_9PROT|nr:pantetheine-phosphate adenylyltransferase [Zavarzinia compransoris]PWR20086.1 pantetheine-phosphate adenylyltransferase [Zavarzinia compransoris]TDP44790.1 phosphopantetheine adenylyltransferase [Zavarzinia compransoris]